MKDEETTEFAKHDLSHLRYIRRVETRLVEDGQFEYFGQPLRTSRQFSIMLDRLRESDREIGIVLFLDRRDMPIGYDKWTGGIDFTTIDPRQVFKLMGMLNASKVVFCHNHPEGEPTPSQSDQIFCFQLCQLCEIMGWEVADFIVLGRPGYYSFKDAGDLALKRPSGGPERIVR